MVEYDFAIIYFGLTRSVRQTHESHTRCLFDVLKRNNISYQTFLHTWKTNDDIQNVWETILDKKIDYEEYQLLKPDFYMLDNEDEYLQTVDMDQYFYRDVYETMGHGYEGEWLPKLVSNYICMLQSQHRGFTRMQMNIENGDTYKYIMFIRPDITLHNEFPIDNILQHHDCIQIPNHSHHGGINDQVAIMNYEYACIYGNRIFELAEFRKYHGRIVAEYYIRHIIQKYNMKCNYFEGFHYEITRP